MVDAGADSEDDVLIIGCNQGVDWQVIHNADSTLTFHINSTTIPISLADWRDAVVQFADSVRKFYEGSAPKSQTDEWAYEGYELMMSEWDRRRSDAESMA